MMRYFSFALKILLITLLLSFQSLGGGQKEKTKTDAPNNERGKIIDSFPLVSIDAQVMSRATGQLMNDLTHDDFVITQENTQQGIVSFQHISAPISLLVVIDLLHGGAEGRRINDQIQALRSSLDRSIGEADRLSLVIIADRAIVLQDFTNDKTRIGDALDIAAKHKVEAMPKTNEVFFRALVQAAEHARTGHNWNARNAVILISGLQKATAGALVLPQIVVRPIIESGSIFCWNDWANVHPDISRSPQRSLHKLSLLDLVGITGGEIIGNDWSSFIERLRNRYRIAYVPLPLTNELNGRLVRIKLELAAKLMKGAERPVLFYPRVAVITAPQ
jgi:hypothetical protein